MEMLLGIKKSSAEYQKGFKDCMKWVKEYCQDNKEEKLFYLGGLIANAELLQEAMIMQTEEE